MTLEDLPALEHEAQPNLEKVEAVEYDRVVLAIAAQVALELTRVLGPVTAGLQMVQSMITVVEATAVVARVDASNAGTIGIVRVLCANKRVLPPIADHHQGTNEQ